MFNAFAVQVNGVVVVPGVHDEATPFSPSRRYVTTVVLVEVLPEVTCKTQHAYTSATSGNTLKTRYIKDVLVFWLLGSISMAAYTDVSHHIIFHITKV